MFLINSTDLVSRFLKNYNIWCDYQQFYHKVTRLQVQQHSTGIPCFYVNDIENINSCSANLIAIDCLIEGLHCRDYFEKYNPDAVYLIFSNGWWDQTKVQLPIKYHLIHYNFVLCEMADTYFSPNRFCFYFDKQYQFEKNKPCVFVSTIGNTRPQRDHLVNQLISQLNYKNFILRYSGEDFGISCTQDVVTINPGEFDPYTSILDQYYHTVSQTLPIDLYNQGYFNLVVESDLDIANEFFLTEKTIKSLITGMPFVVASTPYFLKHLKQLGFHTYSQLWDESYDDIEDFSSRMQKIVQLCNQLNEFPWESNFEILKNIALKNTHNFFNVNRQVEKNFIQFETTLKELA